MAKRTPVTATGVELLALIAAAPDGVLMLTKAEGDQIVTDGLATVDATKVEGDTAAVSLTEAGTKALAGDTAADATAAPAKGGFEIETGVAMPTASRRARTDGYPFASMNVGDSFHVAKTAENPDPSNRLASSIAGAKVKFATDTGKTEEVEVKLYKRDADGKYEKDANGKRILTGEVRKETRPVLTFTRDFKVATVGKDDPKGEGARVWRTA